MSQQLARFAGFYRDAHTLMPAGVLDHRAPPMVADDHTVGIVQRLLGAM
jgi:hypothetical protein